MVKTALKMFGIDSKKIPEMINNGVNTIVNEYVNQPLQEGEIKSAAILMNVNDKIYFSVVALREVERENEVITEITRRIPLTIEGKTKEVFELSELTSKINQFL